MLNVAQVHVHRLEAIEGGRGGVSEIRPPPPPRLGESLREVIQDIEFIQGVQLPSLSPHTNAFHLELEAVSSKGEIKGTYAPW